MKIRCEIKEDTLDVDKRVLTVESVMWPARNVELTFEGKSIKVNAESLKKAIENCCNI